MAQVDEVAPQLTKLGKFEACNVYLMEGAEMALERGEESTEAGGVSEFIIGTGIQVSSAVKKTYAPSAPAMLLTAAARVLRRRRSRPIAASCRRRGS